MCSTGVLNGKVFWMLLGILLCAQQDIIGGLNGDVLCTQWKSILDAPWDIIGVLNWKLLECSMGSYVLNGKLLCAQLDILGVLNGKLGAQWEVMCSMGNYYVLNWTLLSAHQEVRCLTGSYVLKGKL